MTLEGTNRFLENGPKAVLLWPQMQRLPVTCCLGTTLALTCLLFCGSRGTVNVCTHAHTLGHSKEASLLLPNPCEWDFRYFSFPAWPQRLDVSEPVGKDNMRCLLSRAWISAPGVKAWSCGHTKRACSPALLGVGERTLSAPFVLVDRGPAGCSRWHSRGGSNRLHFAFLTWLLGKHTNWLQNLRA